MERGAKQDGQHDVNRQRSSLHPSDKGKTVNRFSEILDYAGGQKRCLFGSEMEILRRRSQ